MSQHSMHNGRISNGKGAYYSMREDRAARLEALPGWTWAEKKPTAAAAAVAAAAGRAAKKMADEKAMQQHAGERETKRRAIDSSTATRPAGELLGS